MSPACSLAKRSHTNTSPLLLASNTGAAWDLLITTGAPGDENKLLKRLHRLSARSQLPSGRQPTPKQSNTLANVDALLEQAASVAPAFHKFFRALVEECGGEYLQGPNKTRERAVEKIEGDEKTRAVFFFPHPTLERCDREVVFVCVGGEWRAEG